MGRRMTIKGDTASILTTEERREGKARLTLLIKDGKQVAFYNPKMSLNRDLAILFATSYFQPSRPIRVCDPMTGSGIRAVRYALECSNITSIIAADNHSETLAVASGTVTLNGLDDRITLFQSDANQLLLNQSRNRFDLVDLDPFGSPSPFFECALRTTLDGGVVAATATDMAPLTGARHGACLRKYGITPVRTEFEKEMAVRILSANIAMSAGKLELGIEIVFAHATDHYARIYATVTKGKTAANQSARSLGFIEYCPECLMRIARISLSDIRSSCDNCGAKTRAGGLLWLGPLWADATVHGMIEWIPALASSRISEVQNILLAISEEKNAPPFHYRTDLLSKTLHMKPPAVTHVLTRLRESGFAASRTHFHSIGFRTNAPMTEIASALKTKEV